MLFAVAVRANTTNLNLLEYPINGFNYTKSLSSYKSRDSVGLYADNTSLPFNNWEKIEKTIFTPTSVKSPEIIGSFIHPGMIIDTIGVEKWSAFIISIKGNKITTSGWVNLKTQKLGTPENNTAILLNPISKVWSTNFNLFLAKEGRARSGVVQENGIVNNNNENPNEVNGIDTVILPISQYGGTAAYLARSATSGKRQQWQLGFSSNGAKIANFYSAGNSKINSTKTGFYENSSSLSGLTFEGKNKNSSIVWRSNERITAQISPSGQVMKISFKTKIINESTKLSDSYYRYIVNSPSNISLELPDTNNLADGYTIEVNNIGLGKILFFK
ncbi:Uncharacterised protein [Pluralibacter gergoviae]|nr:Uncharacterised protein [Pluralibacter gergoviae]